MSIRLLHFYTPEHIHESTITDHSFIVDQCAATDMGTFQMEHSYNGTHFKWITFDWASQKYLALLLRASLSILILAQNFDFHSIPATPMST